MTPHPTFKFFNLHISSHGLLFAVAAEVSGLMLYARVRQCGLDATKVWPLTVSCFLAGLIGARLLFAALYWDQVGSFSELVRIWHGGLVSYGGIIAGTVAALVVLRGEKVPRWAEAVVPVLLVGWGIGRLGNFFAGDSVGVATPLFAATYGRVPIQLMETALCWSLAAFFWRRPYSVWLMAALYFGGRAVIDLWRDEPSVAGIHPSSGASVALFIICLFWYVLGTSRTSD